MSSQLKEALVGKQLTFPDGSRVVLLGDRIVWMDAASCHIAKLKIERVKK
jgi:hypothetical protein